MNLAGLLPLLDGLPAFVECLASLAEPTAELTSQALLPAARPFVAAGLKQRRPGPLVLVTARSEMAQQLVDQLEAWLPPVAAGGPPVYHFADPDALPYERISWGSTTRQRRLTALAALQSRTGPAPVVVTSARALMQKTLPARSCAWPCGPSRLGACCAWSSSPSTGCRRATTPPTSWRSRASSLAAAASSTSGRPICPPRCASTSSETRWRASASSTRRRSAPCAPFQRGDRPRQRGAHQVRPHRAAAPGPPAEAALSGGPAGGETESILFDPKLLLAVREELRLEVEHLRASQAFHGIEWYLPYFYEPAASLLDHLPADATLVVDDALDLLATAEELEVQAAGLRGELERSGEVPRGFAHSFFTAVELRARLLQQRPLLLGYGDLQGAVVAVNTPWRARSAPAPASAARRRRSPAMWSSCTTAPTPSSWPRGRPPACRNS